MISFSFKSLSTRLLANVPSANASGLDKISFKNAVISITARKHFLAHSGSGLLARLKTLPMSPETPLNHSILSSGTPITQAINVAGKG